MSNDNSSYVNLLDASGRSRFFATVNRHGSATLTKNADGGPGVVVCAECIPAQYTWKNGERVCTRGDGVVYHAYMINGRRTVFGTGSASNVVNWLCRTGWVTSGYSNEGIVNGNEGTSGKSRERSESGGNLVQPLLIGIFILAALAGMGLVWLQPVLESALAMIGNVLSVIFKVGLVCGIAVFAVWLWRAAGPLPADKA